MNPSNKNTDNKTITEQDILSLSVVLPIYNEETCILEVIEGISDYLTNQGIPHEIIAVNDGSVDSTPMRLKEAQNAYSNIKIVTHTKNRGYGEALRSGFNAAHYDWILLMDSDGQFKINNLENFILKTTQSDFIIGIREQRADPWFRRLSSKAYILLLKRLFGLSLQDPTCGFKLFRRSLWSDIKRIEATDHKMFTVEWLLRTKYMGAKFSEIPLQHLPRHTGQATGANWNVLWATLRNTWKTFLLARSLQKK